MQQVITEFFNQVLQNDKKTMKRISDFQGELFVDQDSANLVFSIKGLHKLLAGDDILSYIEFRNLIYQSNINEILQTVGAKVEVHESSGKVNGSLYKLIRI